MNDQIFKIELTLNDLNLILSYLGKQPFEQVYNLVSTIQNQAQAQAPAQTQTTAPTVKK